jgi:AraC-like DNA-binding protein
MDNAHNLPLHLVRAYQTKARPWDGTPLQVRACCSAVTLHPVACTVLRIKPLLSKLIIEAVRIKQLQMRIRLHCASQDLLLSQLETAHPMRISLTLPHDRRARVVADRVMRNPAERQPLAAICGTFSASVRTIQRVFRHEVGFDFETWRRRLRLKKAFELLVSWQSVKEVSFALGYR